MEAHQRQSKTQSAQQSTETLENSRTSINRSGQGKNLPQHLYSKMLKILKKQLRGYFDEFLQRYNVKKRNVKQTTNQLILIYLYIFLVGTKKKRDQDQLQIESKRITQILNDFEKYLTKRLDKADLKHLEVENEVEKKKIRAQINLVKELLEVETGRHQLDLQRLQAICKPLFTMKQQNKNQRHFLEIGKIYKEINQLSGQEFIEAVLKINNSSQQEL